MIINFKKGEKEEEKKGKKVNENQTTKKKHVKLKFNFFLKIAL